MRKVAIRINTTPQAAWWVSCVVEQHPMEDFHMIAADERQTRL
jgi:hypothetical protein